MLLALAFALTALSAQSGGQAQPAVGFDLAAGIGAVVPSNRVPLGIDVQASPTSGWGNFVLNILAHLTKPSASAAAPFPVMTMAPDWRAEKVNARRALGTLFSQTCLDGFKAPYPGKATFLKLHSSQKGFVNTLAELRKDTHLPVPFAVLHGVSVRRRLVLPPSLLRSLHPCHPIPTQLGD